MIFLSRYLTYWIKALLDQRLLAYPRCVVVRLLPHDNLAGLDVDVFTPLPHHVPVLGGVAVVTLGHILLGALLLLLIAKEESLIYLVFVFP